MRDYFKITQSRYVCFKKLYDIIFALMEESSENWTVKSRK